MSWKSEVIADNSGEWCGNALRFATKAEAEANVESLKSRWVLVRDTRVVESEDPVNYKWENGRLVDVPRPYKFKWDNYRACMVAEGVEASESEDEWVEAYQYLIDTGVVWSLQGTFGRTAADLIAQGKCLKRATA